jgi:hypothetical protein
MDSVDIFGAAVLARGHVVAMPPSPPPPALAFEPELLSPLLESPTLSPELPITPRSKKRSWPSDPNSDLINEALECLDKTDVIPAHAMALRLARRVHAGRLAGSQTVTAGRGSDLAGVVPGVWRLAESLRDGTYLAEAVIHGSKDHG